MAHRKTLLPRVFGDFTRFPSIMQEANEWFPDIVTFSSERGLSVSEDNGSIMVEAALPGLKPEEIEISMEKGTLWVKGEKKEEEEDKERNYYRKASRSYSYCTTLPEGTNLEEEPEANYEDGIVKISFSKKAETKPRKIEIKKK